MINDCQGRHTFVMKMEMTCQRFRTLASSLTTALILFGMLGQSILPRAIAEDTLPSSPRSFMQKPKLDPFVCQRYFVYRKKKLFCDSNLGMDAEKLRPIIMSSTDAISELDLYQKNRRYLKQTAYVGTIGLVFGILSYILVSKNQPILRGGLAASGLGLAGGSLIYGFSLGQTNESHLGNAVRIHNDLNPKDQIELQFSTGILF